MLERSFDYIIVGGGTAGCVLAARLSSSPDVQVLLIEAGADFLPGEEPASIRDPFPASYGDPKFSWPGLIAEVGADPGDGSPRFSRHYVQGRCVGGSSSIMGMLAMRGLPRDYEEWRALGAAGWGWEDVLPFFRRSEHDHDFDGPLHGKSGPIPIRRNARSTWPPFCRAFADTLLARGYPFMPDCNGQFGDGVGTVPMSNLPDRRVSTAMGYLDTSVRQRPNLQILARSTVETLAIQNQKVTGATVLTPEGRYLARGRETILCSGAIHTPAVLMRSGIGPGARLRELGIDVVVDRPGVGQNLQNHAIVGLAVDLRAHAWQAKTVRTWGFSMLRYSSGHADCPPSDMLMIPMNKTSWHPLGRRIGHLGICVYKPFSRGEVSLQSPDPHVAPAVRMNLLADQRDFERLVDGVRFALAVLDAPLLASLRNEVFVPAGGHANSLNRPSWSNWIKSLLIRNVFALSDTARRRILGAAIVETATLSADTEALKRLVRRIAAPVHHVCGTSRMGSESDRAAVLDPTLRVYGVEGLRVVDASVMPTIVSANTHMPVVMIAERAAELILERR